jgi:dTDP-4-dehydrorhamnose reductase
MRGLAHILTSRAQLDLDDAKSIAEALNTYDPCVIINAAGWVRVDDAEADEDSCFRANTTGPLRLAAAAASRGLRTVQFSSDLVFGGERDAPWVESDEPKPVNAYGRSKAAMEANLRDRYPETLIVRTSAFFSPFDDQNFARAVERALASGEQFRAAATQVIRPTYVPDLANAVLDLVIDGETGIWHLSNGQSVSWDGFAHMIARALELPQSLVESDFTPEQPAKRPPFTALGTLNGPRMPSLASAIDRYVSERRDARVVG